MVSTEIRTAKPQGLNTYIWTHRHMPKWKKDVTEFTVSVNHNETRGYQSSIPKPVIEALGEPDKITFLIKAKKRVELIPATDTQHR